jgi:hypothetical protein
MVEEMSSEKKTIDVQGIKTRKILFQNPDNTYPPPLTFLTMGDTKGHAGWGNTVDTVNARELNSSYDITVNYPAQGTNTLRFTTDSSGCWIEAGATAVAGSAAKLFINNYEDRGAPVATFDIANNRVGINNMTPTCALDVTGGTIKGATLDMQTGYAKIANLDIYDTVQLMPGATMILPSGNNLIVDTLYGNKVVVGTTATGAYTNDLNVVGTMKCTGLGTFAGGITASGATFSGLATYSAGITGTTATFSSLATFSGGITGTTATFSGGITGTTATFSSLATFSGGITGTTATFSGGITAASATVNGTITTDDVVVHETLQVDKTIVCDEDVSAHTFTATSGGGLAVGGLGNRVLNVRTDTVGTYIEVGQANPSGQEISGSGALLNISTIDNTQQTAVFDTTNKQVGIRTVPVLADGFALDVNGTVRTNGYINMQVGVPRSLVYTFNLTADISLANTSVGYSLVCSDNTQFPQLKSYNVILVTVTVPVGSNDGAFWPQALGDFFMKLTTSNGTTNIDSQVYHLMTGGAGGTPAYVTEGYGTINQQFVLVKNTHYNDSSTSLSLYMEDESGNTRVFSLNSNSGSSNLQIYITYLGLV